MNRNKFLCVEFSEYDIEGFSSGILSNKFRGKIIVTPNVDHLVRYHRDDVFRMEYSKADIYVNDSRILKLCSKLFKKPLNSLVPGSDLTKHIVSTCPKDLAITVIGGSQKTIDSVRNDYSLSRISHKNPPMGFIKDEQEIEACIEFCLSNPADLIFLAVGSPQQEILANRLKKSGCNSTFLCIGASFLFLSGEEKRAPLFMRKLHLEWFFRLIQDPKRMYKRYLIEGVKIFPIIFREKLKEIRG